MNAGLYDTLSRQTFEAELTGRFTIDASQSLPGGTRVLYACTHR